MLIAATLVPSVAEAPERPYRHDDLKCIPAKALFANLALRSHRRPEEDVIAALALESRDLRAVK
jgi:hypothetical protein